MIKGIFFDVGGTLCGTTNQKPSFKKVLAKFTNKDSLDFNVKKQKYLWTSSSSKKELIIKSCKDLKINNWEVLYNNLEKYSYNVALYKDVNLCLKKLYPKYKLGILSNTTIWTALDHKNLGIDKYIDSSVLSCRVGFAKPNIEIFDYARKLFNMKKKELLYIGDSIEYDIKPALRAGWNAILLSRDRIIDKSPVSVISNLYELENVLLKYDKT